MKQWMLAIVFAMAVAGCSKDEPPSVRVNNQRSTKANVQFKQSNGNTINQNDVLAGTFSGFQDVAEGAIQVTATIQSESVSPTISFNAAQNTNYTVVIVAGVTPALRIDQQEK